MIPRPPRSTRTDTLFPYTTLFRSILVSLPPGTAPDSGYPVLYVLDGNAMFAGFAEARRIQALGNSGIDKMIIVGIGYPGEQIYDSQRKIGRAPWRERVCKYV